ncbi:GIY-YIG nuclease family protein [Promicromonospora sukumoe]
MAAEIMNWTGHVLKGTRDKLGEIRKRPEGRRTGVYILLGEDTTGGRLAYIGQSDDVGKRLAQHDAKKDFWTEVVIVTSKDANLTSAHVRYLEASLVRMAKSLSRVPLANGNDPSGGAELPEADASDMDYFIEQLRILLPVLGVDLFRGRAPRTAPPTTLEAPRSEALPDTSEVAAGAEASPVFHLRLAKLGIDARAQVIDGEFTVLAGSLISAQMRPSAGKSDGNTRNFVGRSVVHSKVMSDASALPSGILARLQRDIVFTSPSAASAVVQGKATANGRRDWTTGAGVKYAQWEDRGVE